MNSKKLGFVIFALTSLATRNACVASEINFDDVSFPGGNATAFARLPAGYQGFNWGGGNGTDSWLVSPNDATGWQGGAKQPYSHSGNNFVWNNAGTNLELTPSSGTFNLESFWVRSWARTTYAVTAHGYLNGTEIFTQGFTTSDTYAQITANFSGIDRFTLTLPAPGSILLDDISVKVVPAPGALLGGLVGFAPGIYMLLRRRNRKVS